MRTPVEYEMMFEQSTSNAQSPEARLHQTRGHITRTKEAEGVDARSVDVAIVGGGVSGLYSAWSLLSRGSIPMFGGQPTVEVHERSTRLGGRLFSVTPPKAPSLRAELGGMRYLSDQLIVAQLVEHLGLESKPFPLTEADSLVHLRGETIRATDFPTEGPGLHFELRAGERGKSPLELIVQALTTVIPECFSLKRDEWPKFKATCEIQGTMLTDMSLAEVLRLALSDEALELVAMGEGYETLLRRYNAADFLQVMLAAGSFDFRTPVEGFQALPLTLADRISELDGDIHTGSELITVEPLPNGRLRCIFATSGELTAVDSRAVILALGRSALERIDQTCFLFDSPQVRADVTAVAPVPASKLFLAFESAWWEEVAGVHGNLTTDLPLRQVVHFGHEGDDGAGLLLATYNNAYSTLRWKAHSHDGSAPYAGPPPEQGICATTAMVADACEQLAQAYGCAVPEPYWAAFRDWSTDSFGGGWSYWRVGARSFEVMPRIRRPVADQPIFICGDTWSDRQGWVEGALSTAERVLQDHFGASAPEWLSGEVELGP